MPATHLQVTRAQGAMLVLGPASDKEREAMSTKPESTEPEFVMGWDAVGPIGGGLPVG